MRNKTPKLGQHFLHSKTIARRIARAALPRGRGRQAPLGSETSKWTWKSHFQVVLEIGPGKGILTEALIETNSRVIAIEKDAELAGHLREKFKTEIESGQLIIHAADIRDINLANTGLSDHGYMLVANIPYYITGEILRIMLENKVQPRAIAVLMQKEVAERISRSIKESILSLSVKAYGNPQYVETVPKRFFSPQPKVDSAILAIHDISRDFFKNISEKAFFDLLHTGFGHKRKRLFTNLLAHYPKETLERTWHSLALDKNARAEDVPLPMWGAILKHLNQ